ncbi:hypothetical protein ACE6H2_005460 [Prunus campanulata]
MASTAHEASSSSSPSNSLKHWKYDVFLSFRGEDTRKNFTDHLYCTLIDNRVNAYIDEKELPRGENISEELKQAIEQSRISVIVFSNGYADSTWCLEELEKIMECRRRLEQVVLPIFYDVDPTHVRKQTGSFAKAFQTHEANFPEDKDKIQRWRSALSEAANLAGGNLKNNDGYEGKFIEKIVADITRKMNNTYLHVATNQIGIESRVQEVSNYLRVGGSDDVRIIGISGMGGTGKTTVAKAIFNKFHPSFQGMSFLSEVRKGDMVKLQNQLLCDILKPAKIEVTSVDEGTKKIKDKLGSIKVLVIFDDIDCEEQLDKLAIKRESFGPGSRIIVTTRNERVLKILEVDDTCSPQTMSNEEAFQLFCCHAFTKHHPNDEDYLKLSKKVVDYCGGLPRALEVLGSYLRKRTKREWISALKKLKRKPHGKIHEMLKISYDGLIDDEVKAIFLDISCFFIGMNKNYVVTILDGCDYDTEIGIGELHDRCLVSVDEGNNLIMHDLLRDMGREIVREKSPNITGKRSRLWDPEDVKDVLRSKCGSEEIEGLTLDLQESQQDSFSAKALEGMQGLRLLKLNGVNFKGHCKHLSKKLSLLCWPECPLKSMPQDFIQPNMVDIDLSRSRIEVWKDSDVTLEKLKFLNLGGCNRLKRFPNFSKLPNLEKLILQDCKSLSKIFHSIVQLKNLKYLYLADCKLADRAIPKDLGGLSSLRVLDLRGNAFKGLPTLSHLSKLQTLQLSNCSNLLAIPDLPTNLEILQADGCIALEKMPKFSAIPEDLGGLSSLRVLDLRGNAFKGLATLSHLSKLQTLQLSNCSNLLAIPDLPTNLEILQADGCIALEKMPKFSEMLCMRELHLNRSPKLTEIIGLEKSLNSMTRIHMEECTNLTPAFKAILQGWSANGNGVLFLPGNDSPSLFRRVDPMGEITCCLPIPKFML